MTAMYPELDKLYWECSRDEGVTCIAPIALHTIIRRDYENAPSCQAVLDGHEEALLAAEKINEYLKDFSDEEIFIIQAMTEYSIGSFIEDMDQEIRDFRAEQDEAIARQSSPVENHI